MKILIRLPNWLGDLVMSTAFVGAVRQSYSDGEIDVIIKKELGGIASLIPGLNQVHLFSKQEHSGLHGVYRFGKTLQAEKYDLFFCLPDSLSSAVMGWATGAKRRVGFGKEGRVFLMTNTYKKPANLHRTDEYISLLEQYTGTKITKRFVKLQAKTTESNDSQVVLNFNSEAVSRRMPLDKGKQLISMLINTFKNTRFVIIGSQKEKAYVDDLLKGAAGQIENKSRRIVRIDGFV